jgi:hypothetical protein
MKVLPQVLQKNMAVFSFLSQLAQEGRSRLEFATRNLKEQQTIRQGTFRFRNTKRSLKEKFKGDMLSS